MEDKPPQAGSLLIADGQLWLLVDTAVIRQGGYVIDGVF